MTPTQIFAKIKNGKEFEVRIDRDDVDFAIDGFTEFTLTKGEARDLASRIFAALFML